MEHARAVIIGGGVGGTSIAYHLTELGWTDIVLVDRAELTSGSTFHSAGLVGQLRSSVTLTRMMMYGAELYRRLAAETGTDPSWHEVGSLRLASSPARFEELRRQAGWAKTFGLPLDLITADEAQALIDDASSLLIEQFGYRLKPAKSPKGGNGADNGAGRHGCSRVSGGCSWRGRTKPIT